MACSSSVNRLFRFNGSSQLKAAEEAHLRALDLVVAEMRRAAMRLRAFLESMMLYVGQLVYHKGGNENQGMWRLTERLSCYMCRKQRASSAEIIMPFSHSVPNIAALQDRGRCRSR